MCGPPQPICSGGTHLGEEAENLGAQRLGAAADIGADRSDASIVSPWIASTCAVISSVALAVWPASPFTSAATTAKPRSAAPARVSSTVA